MLHVIFIGKLYYKVRDAGNWHTISPYNYCFVWDFSTLHSLRNVLISKFKCLQNILLSLIVFLKPQLKFFDLNGRSNYQIVRQICRGACTTPHAFVSSYVFVILTCFHLTIFWQNNVSLLPSQKNVADQKTKNCNLREKKLCASQNTKFQQLLCS